MEETKRELIKDNTIKMGREALASGTGKGKQFGLGLASGCLLFCSLCFLVDGRISSWWMPGSIRCRCKFSLGFLLMVSAINIFY